MVILNNNHPLLFIDSPSVIRKSVKLTQVNATVIKDKKNSFDDIFLKLDLLLEKGILTLCMIKTKFHSYEDYYLGRSNNFISLGEKRISLNDINQVEMLSFKKKMLGPMP